MPADGPVWRQPKAFNYVKPRIAEILQFNGDLVKDHWALKTLGCGERTVSATIEHAPITLAGPLVVDGFGGTAFWGLGESKRWRALC